MKTQSNTQETAKSQMRRIVLRASAVLFSVILLSWTVTAQNFWKHLLTENTYGKMAMMMVDQTSEFEKADAVADAIHAEIKEKNINSAETYSLETVTDKNLDVEIWMTDEALFSANSAALTVETDKPLTLESWMISDLKVNAQMVSAPVENEPALRVEDWMTNEANFTSAEMQTEKDSDLNIENWMLDEALFESATQANEPLKLEAWMADSKVWGF
ncbi:MAG: hypothetical protein WC384_03495 [Prolixibacteraceae bacterium]|jgi:hypothetical protein